jgi:hypothetical protein
MKTWIRGAFVAAGLVLFGAATLGCSAAASSSAGVRATTALKATDLSARRHDRHHKRYAYQPSYRPYYYDRPSYYRPYPYDVPVPFFLGLAYSPRW